jgi:hypothetical protein
MAAGFLALNSVFGRFFEVDEAELFEPAAGDEKFPKNQFVFDIHTHHVAAGKIIRSPNLLAYRAAGAAWGNRELRDRQHRWEDLYLANYIKEMFLDSDTVMAVITGLPAKTDAENVLPPAEMIETRAETVRTRPELVQRFVAEALVGWVNYLYGNRNAANALMIKENPEMSQAEIEASVALMKSQRIVDSSAFTSSN